MIPLQSYLRFPSKAPFAWFVYCMLYILLYTVILFTQQTLVGNTTAPQKLLQIQGAVKIAYVIWHVLILVPLIQIAQNILLALGSIKNKKFSAKMAGITILLLVVLCIVVLYVLVILAPTGSENLRLPKITTGLFVFLSFV